VRALNLCHLGGLGPGAAAFASWVGSRFTLNVKSMMQRCWSFESSGCLSRKRPWLIGANLTSPVGGETVVMSNAWLAHPVPARPVAVGLSTKAPGSATDPGSSHPASAGFEHAGTIRREVTCTSPIASMRFELLTSRIEAGTSTWPGVTAVGKSGLIENPVAAAAGGAKVTMVVKMAASSRSEAKALLKESGRCNKTVSYLARSVKGPT
jgi:hypothetical protein